MLPTRSRLNKLVWLLLAGVGFPAAAFGQASISASPAEIHFLLKPGESGSQTVQVNNGGDSPFSLNTYAWDWWYEGNESQYGEIGTHPQNSAASWLTFAPNHVLVPPGKDVDVKVTASPPPGKSGSYFAVAFTEMAPPEKKPGQTTIFLGGRLGVIVTVTLKGTEEPKAALEGLWIYPPTSNEPGKIVYRMRNEGNVFLSPKGNILLMDEGNPAKPVLAARTEFEGQFIFPGTARDVETVFSGNLKPGKKYHAILNFQLNDRIPLSQNASMVCETNVGLSGRNEPRRNKPIPCQY